MSIYLDFNSSSPIDDRVLEEMIFIYKNIIGNPDSRTHIYGDKARQIVEKAREEVASILNINKNEVIFTSGATESNNIAFSGLKEYAQHSSKKHIITSSIEHKSIIQSAKNLVKEGFEVDFINPDKSGIISIEKLKNLIRKDTLLISIMHVNNEIGTIQPVKEIGEYLYNTDILFHIDATQSFGKLVEELKDIKYNMLSMSGHKIGGPQGIGALILRKINYKSPPIKGIIFGGQQEKGIRPGTVPVALVAGLGKACEIAKKEYIDYNIKCFEIKKEIIKILDNSNITYFINGEQKYCISNTINICLKGVNSEALILYIKDFCAISNGSACNSKSYEPSFVLKSMGLSLEDIECSIRISWGNRIDINVLKREFEKVINIAKSIAF